MLTTELVKGKKVSKLTPLALIENSLRSSSSSTSAWSAAISHEFQDEIIKLLLAISSNRGTEVADACTRMSEIGEGFDAIASQWASSSRRSSWPPP